MDEENFKDITNEIWRKINQIIILGAVGTFSPAWFVLKFLFIKNI